MYDPLGLSIGTTNLVAVRSGNPPVSRRAVLTLFPDRAPELGVPVEDPDAADTGTLMTGFVERVGGSNALKSADGSNHDPALLLVEALDALITATGGDASTSNITMAVPAHWEPQALRGLQDALCTHAGFVRGGMSPRLVSDSVAALTALNSDSRLPANGVVALLDFGGGGHEHHPGRRRVGLYPHRRHACAIRNSPATSLTRRCMVHVLDNVGHTKGADPASTGVVGQFAGLREECRLAKERLSNETVTELVVELPGQRCPRRGEPSRAGQPDRRPAQRLLSAFDDMLRRNRVRRRDLAAVAMAGGGAKIPVVAQRLSSHAKASVVTAVQPGLAMAVGAVMLSARQPIEQQEEDAVEEPTMAALVGASTGSFATSTGTFAAPTDTLGASTGTFEHRPDVTAPADAFLNERPVGDAAGVGLVAGRRFRQRAGGLHR